MSIRMAGIKTEIENTDHKGFIYRMLQCGKLKAPFIVTSAEKKGIFFVYNVKINVGAGYLGEFISLAPFVTDVAKDCKELTLGPFAMWQLYDKPVSIENEPL